MDIEVSIDELAAIIAEALRSELEVEEDGNFIFRFSNPRINVEFHESRERLEEVVSNLKKLEEVDETVISSNKSFEVLVKEEGNIPTFFMRRREGPIENEDSDNGYRYKLGAASQEYIVFLLSKVAKVSEARYFIGSSHYSMWERVLEKHSSALDILAEITPRMLTLSVESTKSRSFKEFQLMASAYLFQFSYNLDIALVQQRFIEEIIRRGRVIRHRKSGFDDFDAPKRKYIPDLIHHYQLGVGADNPVLEFISFYHVIEHFFESIFNDDLIERIKDKITKPDFSYKRKKDVMSLVKDVSKSLQIRSETITFNEASALTLTLKKHIVLSDLKAKLEDFDDSLIDYYKNNKVLFSEGQAVDFNLADENVIYKNLASRIYRTRNAIVHSKEGDKTKFVPFHHERLLLKEIPLIRMIAEALIIETSEIIN